MISRRRKIDKPEHRPRLSIVIGRISDTGLGGPNEAGWREVRRAQLELAKQDDDGAWVDTDDLHGGEPNKPRSDVHYPRQGLEILGQRLADKAIELIRKKSK